MSKDCNDPAGGGATSRLAETETLVVDAEPPKAAAPKAAAKSRVNKAEEKVAVAFHEFSHGLKNRKAAKDKLERLFEHPHLDKLRVVFESSRYDAFISSVVLFNLVLIIIETDYEGRGMTVPGWVNSTNLVVLIAFVAEVGIKAAVYQKSWARNFWNLLDGSIVGIDITFLVLSALIGHMPRMSIFRIVRLVRLSRSVKFLQKFPELGLMLSALKGALKSLAWGMLLLMLALTIFGIMAVQLIHPVNQRVADRGTYDGCERCPRAFETVWMAILTTFQTDIAGDSWGTVAVPISEESPLAWAFFVMVLVLLQMLVMNVILAAVLDSATQARSENIEIIAKEREQEMKSFHGRLMKLCAELDEDGNGELAYQEVVDGFSNNEAFYEIMEAMDIFPEDIASVWGILDRNHNGVIDYKEFAEELFKVKSEDSHTMMVFIKYQVASIQDIVKAEMAKLADQTDMLHKLTEKKAGMLDDLTSHTEQLKQISNNRYAARADENTQAPSSAMTAAAVKFEEMPGPSTQASKSPVPTEAKLTMPANTTDISLDIFELCRALEDKLDATRSVIDSMAQSILQRAAEEVNPRIVSGAFRAMSQSDLLAAPGQPATIGQGRCIPPLCCGGASGAAPPSSILSIAEAQRR
jgi:voltage-gated sodium channel